MRFRKLRIAWSVAWGLAAVLLIVLWVRSYWWSDQIIGEALKSYPFAESARGQLAFGMPPRGNLEHAQNADWTLRSYAVSTSPKPYRIFQPFAVPYYYGFVLPHWFAVVLIVAIAVVPWLRWSKRFTLRTLLTATTMVAVVLGLIVWLR